MASNKELRALAVELAQQLGIEAPTTEGLNHDDLEQLVASLEQQVAALPGETPPPSDAPAPAAGEAPPAAPPSYVVAKGVTIQCPGGTLEAGSPITSRDLVKNPGKDLKLGETLFAEHLANETIVRAP